jgi:suppressor of fused protein SUFU
VFKASAAKVVLSETSPYRSRTLVIESDRVSSAAYLKDAQDRVIGAAWIANHRKGPQELDQARVEAGRPPALPATATKHPGGRPALDAAALEVVWFEEGDGAAVLESGEPICVIPVWSDVSRGIPGYSRDAITQSPYAYPLDSAIGDFGPRIRQAQAYWDWRVSESAWAGFQQSALGHLLGRLGPGGQYWHDVGRQWRTGAVSGDGADSAAAPMPLVGVSERPPRAGRDHAVLSTVGMSCQRMPTVELYKDDISAFTRIELAVATTLPSRRAGGVFPWLAQYPWRSVRWLSPGDVVTWDHESRPFPLGASGSRGEAVLLLDDPGRLAGPPAPDMSGFGFGGDPVTWLWLVPVTGKEREYAATEGPDALIRSLADQGRSWIVSA